MQALSADPEVADDELRELLYAPHADLRMAALGTLVARLERHDLEDLLARYPNERRACYDNVIAELDRLLYVDAAVGVPADTTS
ncbi:MAG TPA: hypothetical protein VNQ77_00345 [Frankiaceae bacterium]|nr:hypothetical protein [Frankiaceae bacterium]